MKSIICRADSARNHIVFLLDTLDTTKDTISVWRNYGDAKLDTVTLEYYRTTLPLSDSEETTLVRKFTDVFKITEGVILRRRLYKVSPSFQAVATSIAGAHAVPAPMQHVEIVPHPAPAPYSLSDADRQAIAAIVINSIKHAFGSMSI